MIKFTALVLAASTALAPIAASAETAVTGGPAAAPMATAGRPAPLRQAPRAASALGQFRGDNAAPANTFNKRACNVTICDNSNGGG